MEFDVWVIGPSQNLSDPWPSIFGWGWWHLGMPLCILWSRRSGHYNRFHCWARYFAIMHLQMKGIFRTSGPRWVWWCRWALAQIGPCHLRWCLVLPTFSKWTHSNDWVSWRAGFPATALYNHILCLPALPWLLGQPLSRWLCICLWRRSHSSLCPGPRWRHIWGWLHPSELLELHAYPSYLSHSYHRSSQRLSHRALAQRLLLLFALWEKGQQCKARSISCSFCL